MRIFLKLLFALSIVILAGCQTFTAIPGTTVPPRDTVVADQAITLAIKSAFFDSGAYSDAAIEVLTESGMVTLSGFVKTIRQYDTAVQIASETNGVKGVRNHLVIRK